MQVRIEHAGYELQRPGELRGKANFLNEALIVLFFRDAAGNGPRQVKARCRCYRGQQGSPDEIRLILGLNHLSIEVSRRGNQVSESRGPFDAHTVEMPRVEAALGDIEESALREIAG